MRENLTLVPDLEPKNKRKEKNGNLDLQHVSTNENSHPHPDKFYDKVMECVRDERLTKEQAIFYQAFAAALDSETNTERGEFSKKAREEIYEKIETMIRGVVAREQGLRDEYKKINWQKVMEEVDNAESFYVVFKKIVDSEEYVINDEKKENDKNFESSKGPTEL